jgi:ribosomal protein L22
VAAIETQRRDVAEGRETDVVETRPKEVRAEAKYVRTAPRKAQLVAAEIRGRSVPEARTILTFMTRDAARDVAKVLASAVANAEQNHGLVGDDLYVSSAYVGAGPVLKRWRARARGRVARVRKRTCHIAIGLSPADGGAIPEPSASAPAEAPAPEETKPKRARRKAAEPAAAESTTTEEKPKRRSPRQKKTETESGGER